MYHFNHTSAGNRPRILPSVLLLCLLLSLLLFSSGCSGGPQDEDGSGDGSGSRSSDASKPVELVVFAASSMTETLNQISDLYASVAPNVTLVYNFESSGTLNTQIQEGAVCDLFISAAQKQMDQLDIASDSTVNGQGLDFIDSNTRVDLLKNSVVLIVPEGSDSTVAKFSDVAGDTVSLIALGNSDVPVGQYSQEILTSMGLWEQLNRNQKITFGSNVKEVLSQVAEAAVDCGVVYRTDAATAKGVKLVATAPEGSHSPIIYPAGVLKTSSNQEEAAKFLKFLQTDACGNIFESVGFILPEEK